jgi:hypothetical protein
VNEMDEIRTARRRVESAGDLAVLLDAGWDALGLIASVCRACEKRADELFGAFMLASVAADEALLALTSAPSMPSSPADPGGEETLVDGPVEAVADQVSDLARVLASSLTAAGTGPADPEDQAVCREAASAVSRVAVLLSRGAR